MGEQREGVYYFKDGSLDKPQVNVVNTDHLWHRRLGHPSRAVLSLLLNNLGVISSNVKDDVCEICHQAKQARTPSSESSNKAKFVFNLVHRDIWGPYNEASSCRAHYFLTIVDDISRATWVYLMINRAETSKLLQDFILMVQNQFGTSIKIIRSDNGSEFTSKTMQQFYEAHGILRQSSCVDTPQQNCRVERKHRHILNVARALLFQASLPLKFWGECVLTAAYLINRTPSKLLNGKTPYEMLYRTTPSYGDIKLFGTLCFAPVSYTHLTLPTKRIV